MNTKTNNVNERINIIYEQERVEREIERDIRYDRVYKKVYGKLYDGGVTS